MRDIRTFVRCGDRVVELTAARPLTVGRADECDVVLDDELASREHFRLELVGDRVDVVDLGSRNGVLVNGLRVDGRQEVHHGDLITAGRSQVSVSRQAHRPRTESTDAQAAAERRPRLSSSGDLTGTGSVFEILGGSARRSLEDGDLPSAEQSARNLFLAVKSSVARGRDLGDAIFVDAAEVALAVAERAGDIGWVDRVLETFVAAKRPLSSALTDRAIAVARGIGEAPRALDDYIELAKSLGDPSVTRLAELRR